MRDGDEVELTLTGCEFKRVGEKQTAMCELRGDTIDGDSLTVAIWLSEKAAGIARQQFKRIGFEVDKHNLNRLAEFISAAPRTVTVVVESHEYQGTMQYRGVIDIGGAGRMAKDDLTKMTGFLRAAKKNRDEEPASPAPTKPAAPAPAPPKKPINDDVNFDDIPFSFIAAMLAIVGATLFA